MRSKRSIVLAAIAAAFLLAATAAQASAKEFVFSKTGALAGTIVESWSVNTQQGVFACSKEKLGGSVTSLLCHRRLA